MRVGYLTYGLDRTPTGIGRYAVQLARELATLQDDLELVVLASEREDVHGLTSLAEYHQLPGVHMLPSLLTLGSVLLYRAAQRYDLDIIHDPNGIAPFLAPTRNTRRVVTIHDAFAYIYPDTHNRLDNWRYHWHLPYAARRADAVITVSHCSRSDLVRTLGLQAAAVHVSAEGVEKRFVPMPDDQRRRTTLSGYGIDGPYLLYLGGLNARKNIGRLLDAFSCIREHHAGISLVIGGKRQWQTGEIDATVKRLNLNAHVRFTGYVDDADLPDLYSGAEAFVFPSLYEGFGLPPLEAMACGTPVITSNVSSLPEVVGEAALLVDPTDVRALAQSMDLILSNPDLRDRLRERGRTRAAQFSWERAALDTLAVYEQMQPLGSDRSKSMLRESWSR